MEFEDVSDRLKYQTRQITVAFGVEGGDLVEPAPSPRYSIFYGWVSVEREVELEAKFSPDDGELRSLDLDNPSGAFVGIGRNRQANDRWEIFKMGDVPFELEAMARGLYRLGIEDEGVLSQLPTLSSHEKLELRLSMPREFWPQKWLDEEAANY